MTMFLFHRYKAKSNAKTSITKSNHNNEGMLTYAEILKNYLTFISPASEGYYVFKDEL